MQRRCGGPEFCSFCVGLCRQALCEHFLAFASILVLDGWHFLWTLVAIHHIQLLSKLWRIGDLALHCKERYKAFRLLRKLCHKIVVLRCGVRHNTVTCFDAEQSRQSIKDKHLLSSMVVLINSSSNLHHMVWWCDRLEWQCLRSCFVEAWSQMSSKQSQ